MIYNINKLFKSQQSSWKKIKGLGVYTVSTSDCAADNLKKLKFKRDSLFDFSVSRHTVIQYW